MVVARVKANLILHYGLTLAAARIEGEQAFDGDKP